MAIVIAAVLPLSFGCVAEVDQPTAVAIFGGGSVACAKSQSDEVKCWGNNDLEYYPVLDVSWTVGDDEPLSQLSTLDIGGSLLQFEVSKAPGGAACMLLKGERLRCWGQDAEMYSVTGADLLPNGEAVSLEESEDVFVTGLSAVSMYSTHACMLVQGDVFCWGITSKANWALAMYG